MNKYYFKFMLYQSKIYNINFEYIRLKNSISNFGSTEENEELLNNSYYFNLDILNYIIFLFDKINILSFIFDNTFLIKNIQGNIFYYFFDIKNNIFDIYNFTNNYTNYYIDYFYFIPNLYNNKYNLNNHINYLLNSFFLDIIDLNIKILSDIKIYIYDFIFFNIINNIEFKNENLNLNIFNMNIKENIDYDNINEIDEWFDIEFDPEFPEFKYNNKEEDDINLSIFDITKKYKHLWVQCESCYGLNYKKFFKSKMYICEYCGYHLRMNSSDRINLFVDTDTWEPFNEDIVSIDPIEFDSEEDPYINKISFYQNKTGLDEAIQTGIGKLDGIITAIGIMDFNFMGGSMGSVVGEKITRLIEYANNKSLPLIIMCASGGARMQEGSFSLTQMAKISSSLYDYQLNNKLLYISILTSPTTGGVTASFGMLGDIIISEPNAYIAFAGKRVIEQTLNQIVPDGIQEAEFLFDQGLLDLIVPRNILKSILIDLFKLHGFFPL
uniref:Acetyl-coenzyme A carboxylase carboxyl transferase subunit beta n=2 Tax=Epipogium aphyllum TaxID=449980 RepID=A0A0B4PKD3_9ASPA|nr:acetyl-CoA carboxylase carboxyltransferase beta subunit [Epipogium aphyllum]